MPADNIVLVRAGASLNFASLQNETPSVPHPCRRFLARQGGDFYFPTPKLRRPIPHHLRRPAPALRHDQPGTQPLPALGDLPRRAARAVVPTLVVAVQETDGTPHLPIRAEEAAKAKHSWTRAWTTA